MNKKTMKILFTLIIVIYIQLLILPKLLGEEKKVINNSHTVKELINEIKETKDKQKKSEHRELLRKNLPQTKEERELIIKFLDEEDTENKCVAMVLLGKIKDKESVPRIIPYLKHKEDKVKITAVMVLGEIGDKRAIEPLLEDPELIVLEFGASPVAKFGQAALPKLIKLARKKSLTGFLSKDGKTDRRSRKAAYAIGEIRDRKAIPALMDLLKNEEDSNIKLSAVKALAAMKVKEAETEFDKLLIHEDTLIRSTVLKVLTKVNKEKYLPVVLNFLDVNNISDFHAATEILVELKETNAIPKLEEFLEYGVEINYPFSEWIRHYATIALWKITGKIYKYKKGNSIIIEEKSYKRMINDMIKRGEKRDSVENFFKTIQQERCYLFDITFDELLTDIEK